MSCKDKRCDRSCRCDNVCDPCKKQPKLYYCGKDISCIGAKKSEEIHSVINKMGDKLCQIVNEQSPLTYVNIEDATTLQCAQGGLVLQILQVGTDNLISEHILCNEASDFEFPSDIVCGGGVVISEGENISDGVGHVVSYFCERFENIPEPTIAEDITCGEDVVVEEGAGVEEAITNVVEYFCERVEAVETGFIPLSGTEVGSPVTGDIEIDSSKGFKYYGTEFGGDVFFKPIDDSLEGYSGWGVFIDDDNYSAITSDSFQVKASGFTTGITNTGTELFINLLPPSKGLVGNDYFGANYDDFTYVQKKYVDTAMIPLDYGDIVSAGGIENAQVYTTGSGTGIASVDLSPTMAIGKDVTVSDLGNDASTHNIQIDSGVGNTILYNGVASQDITLNTDGASVVIRKMTSTQFMVIAEIL